jgi:hypothetical protein
MRYLWLYLLAPRRCDTEPGGCCGCLCFFFLLLVFIVALGK